MTLMRFSRGTSSCATRCFLAGVLVIGAGCAVVGIKTNRSPEYGDALERWSRSARLYRGLETKLEAWAVYQSPDFLRHYIVEYSMAFGLTPQERSDMLKEKLKEAEEWEEFVLIVHTTFSENNDLSASDSTWKVNLVRGRHQETGGEVSRVWWKKDFITRFYPMVDPWARAYLVRFPAPDPASEEAKASLTLEITGPAGKVEMIWKEEAAR